jgi:hypothetical protein
MPLNCHAGPIPASPASIWTFKEVESVGCFVYGFLKEESKTVNISLEY